MVAECGSLTSGDSKDAVALVEMELCFVIGEPRYRANRESGVVLQDTLQELIAIGGEIVGVTVGSSGHRERHTRAFVVLVSFHPQGRSKP